MTSPPGPYVGPTDWSPTVEVTSARLDNTEFGLSKSMLYIQHNGTSWPARSTVTTSSTVRVGFIGPAPQPADFIVGTDVLFDTSVAGTTTGTTATARAPGGPLNTPVLGSTYYPWTGATATWTAPTQAAATVKGDTSVSVGGETSLAITTKGDGVFMSTTHGSRTSFDFTAHPGYALALWVWVDDPTALKALAFYVGSGASASYYSDLLTAAPTADKPVVYPGAWRKITLHPGFMNISGTPNPAALIRIAVNIQDAGRAVTVRISDYMRWEPCAATLFPNGVVSMDFDDTGASVKLAIPVLNSRGWRGSLVPITNFAGLASMLTWNEIKDIQNQLGWPVKSHCRYNTTPVGEHNGYTTLTATQMVDAITGNQAILQSQGLWGGEHWAAPNGAYGLGVEATRMVLDVLAPYVDTARITQSLRPIGTLPPANRMMLENKSDVGGPSNPISGYTTATTGTLDKVVASGGWTHMTFHSIITSGTPVNNQILLTDFTTLCTAIASRNIAVLPTAEVVEALR